MSTNPTRGAPGRRRQTRSRMRQGRKLSLYVLSAHEQLIRRLADRNGWTWSRAHGELLAFFLARDTRTERTLCTEITTAALSREDAA